MSRFSGGLRRAPDSRSEGWTPGGRVVIKPERRVAEVIIIKLEHRVAAVKGERRVAEVNLNLD